MELWIARHGPNVMGGLPHLDRDRALTPRGVKHVVAVASRLKRDGQSPRAVFTSTFKRCVQTADIFARTLGTRTIPTAELCPEMPVWDFVVKCCSEDDKQGVMIVSHHTALAEMLAKYGDGAAPTVLACGEARRYSCAPYDAGHMVLRYRVTPADCGMFDMVTLKDSLEV